MDLEFAEPAARDWQFARSVAGIALLVEAGREHGAGVDVVLRGTGLGPADLTRTDGEVTADQELRAVRNLVRALDGTAEPGLDVGTVYHLSSFGILGYALLTSPTVLDAMNLALRFIDLSFTFVIPAAVVEGGRVHIVLDDTGLPEDVRRFLVARDLVAIRTVLDELLPQGVPVLAAELALPAPTDPDVWQRALGLRPRFDAGRHSLTLDPACLGEPLPQGNPATLALCESLCADVVSRRRERAATTESVRVLLTQRVAFGVGMLDVADALGISVRTLRRRLADEGTSFQRVLDEVRFSLADEMLATGVLGVEDIAMRLGYAEASSFIHAYKRWTGTSPGRAR